MLPNGRDYELRLFDKDYTRSVVGTNAFDDVSFDVKRADIITGLDIRFNITQTCTFVNNATISVCNLNSNTISKYISLFSYISKGGSFSHVELYGGYRMSDDGGRVGQIFTGDIITLTPSIPPDVWSTMTCWTGYSGTLSLSSGNQPYSVDEDGATGMPVPKTLYDAVEVCSYRVFGDVRLTVHGDGLVDLMKETKVGQVFFSGNVDRILRKMNSYSNTVRVMIQDGRLHVYSIRDYGSFNNDWSENEMMVVCKENGMIGIPRVSECGMKVDVDLMLDPRYRIFDRISLRSDFIDKYKSYSDVGVSNTYRIIGINQNGHLRGGQWKTTLHLLNDSYVDPAVIGSQGDSYFSENNNIANMA